MDLFKVKEEVVDKLNKFEGSMTDLAREAGVSRPYLYDLMKGNIHDPKIGNLQRLKNWFDAH